MRWVMAIGCLGALVVGGCDGEQEPPASQVPVDGWTETVSALTADGPSVTFSASSTTGPAPLSIYFDGSRSRPAADGSWIAACALDYGDGQSTTNCWGVHSYTAGSWTATFRVTDSQGRSAQAQLAITAVGPAAPDAGSDRPAPVLTASPTQGIAPQSVYLDGTRSRPAADGSWISACLLDFGDGQSTTSCWGVHSYTAGTWTARFTATDNRGRSAVATQVLTIQSAAGAPDAGPPVDAGMPDGGVAADAGTPDSGVGTDAGTTDAGTTDAGPGSPDAGPPGTTAGWTFYGAAQGLPQNIHGASADEAGNVWVAGGRDGLFLLEPGAVSFRRFTVADGLTGANDGSGLRTQPVISVAGGPAGTVFAGYEGLPNCAYALEVHDFDNAYAYLWKSGDADRVELRTDGGVAIAHYDISSGPGVVAAEPQGREKICTIYRIAYHAASRSVWFGGNHGVAWGDAQSTAQEEHTHPAINGYVAVRNPDGTTVNRYTLLTDLYYGIAPLPDGDVWIGGANRSALFRWSSLGRSFWSADTQQMQNRIDLWPDAIQADALPSQRTDDLVTDMAVVTDGTVWVSSVQNGLAHWTPSGTFFLRDRTVEPNSKATALEVDPADGSLWVGYIWGGLTRIARGVSTPYDARVFGSVINGRVSDIQSDLFDGQRRIIVSFAGQPGVPSGLAIYTGP